MNIISQSCSLTRLKSKFAYQNALFATVLHSDNHLSIRNGLQLRDDEAFVEPAIESVESDPLAGNESLRLVPAEVVDADRVVRRARIEDAARLFEQEALFTEQHLKRHKVIAGK